MTDIKSPKKLIEVALPLDDINAAAAREKSIRHGHPSTLHLWWARRPLAAARAVLFAQLVNDPGYQRELGYGVNKQEAERKREKLFDIIRDFVKWENTNNEEVLSRAREAIWESWRETCHLNRNHPQAAELFDPEKLPAFHDPFAGGGAIPLEAQRLGLESHASDLNPVAVMINKAMIEIPPKFAGQPPVGPLPEQDTTGKDTLRPGSGLTEYWSGARGLAEDVRRYGHWMHEEAFKRIGHLYPKVKINPEIIAERPDLEMYANEELTVIAWLWVKTVNSPSPAFEDVRVPLASTYLLSKKKGDDHYVEVEADGRDWRFVVRRGEAPDSAKKGNKLSRGANFSCVVSGAPIGHKYVKEQGKLGRIGSKLMGIVLQGKRERVYISPSVEHEEIAKSAVPDWEPNLPISGSTQYLGVKPYGIEKFSELFTKRQLVALNEFFQLIGEVEGKIEEDFRDVNGDEDEAPLSMGGRGSIAYAQAVCSYLVFALGKVENIGSTVASWMNDRGAFRETFARQAIQMTWDYAEANPFASAGGSFLTAIDKGAKSIAHLPANQLGSAVQFDATLQDISKNKVVSTDPPYYDNVPYADLSDFFYVWMRRGLRKMWPDIFSTIAVPKSEELVAFSHRHESRDVAESFFMKGMKEAMKKISWEMHPAFPITIYYAFKQVNESEVGAGNTGWETFLAAVIESGLEIHGTWPMRTEGSGRLRGLNSNALASSIVLVCRKRMPVAETTSRRNFQRQLREEMPEALEAMIGGQSGQAPIAPVDLAQAAIGPGMAIYSKYEAVLNQDGSLMSVHDALVLINRAITEFLTPDSGNFDADTQFCASWFDQYAWSSGPFGEADTLARAKGTSVDGVKEAGVVESGAGKVRLLKWSGYESDWDPAADKRTPVWEACHQMIRRLQNHGESAAGELLAKMPEKGEAIRQLAYHLYTLCERKKWADEARAYNELIGSWHAIVAASHETGHAGEQVGFDL
ncbi:DUF1156 domain-containing protein [Halomonas aquatica]|uniref:DUF1156 domain-containing protein n=1 Tax=Halomonas aquatica TaxID=3151123 RepID=A0ABV1NI50_9GAMM